MSAAQWLAAAAIASATACGGWLGGYRLVPSRGLPPWQLPTRGDTAGRGRAAPPDAIACAALLDAMAAEVRAGSSLATAWTEAVTRHPLRGAVVRPGCALHDALPLRSSHASEAVVLQAVHAAHALGGSAAATLDAGAAVLRERAAAVAEAYAHSAQARLSARVLTAVPLGFAAWSALGSASFRAALGTGAGVTALALGGLLNLVGWWWMRRVVGRVAR